MQAYSDAYLTEDAFVSMIGMAEFMYGSALEFKTYDATMSGGMARVTYT